MTIRMVDPKSSDLALSLFEKLPIGVIVYRLDDPNDDESLRLVGFNTAAALMLRPDLEDLVGKRMREAFPNVETARLLAYAEIARHGGRRDMGQTTYSDPRVTKQTFAVSALGLGDGGLAVIVENLSELKRTTAFLDAIVENIPNMVFVKEAKELRFERFNKAGELLLGLERAALMGKNDYDFFPVDQANFFQERDRATLASKQVVDIPEEPIDTAKGKRWLHTRKVPIMDSDGTPRYLLGISEDITEWKAKDDRLRDLVAQLEESNAELDGFSYSVSHDLRAPLRAIDGFTRMLLEDHGEKLGDEGRRVANVIAKNAVKMGHLIDDLLAFSRLGRKQVEKRHVDMSVLASSAAEESREVGRGIEFRVGELPPAHGDGALLKQVWLNLLSNAVKYTRKREKPLIEVAGAKGPRESVYTVKDNGVGFDARYQSKLFGVFQRLHTASDYEGTGVGLALVQRIVSRHGGWVKAESVLEQGAVFTFGLPNA